ncbi:MAG: glycosyltransferase family 8 protein [Pseudomonadota bacterium]
MPQPQSAQAYVTLVTNSDYARGAYALARSLRAVGATAPLLVLLTDDSVDVSALEALGCPIVPVSVPEVSEAFKIRHARERIHGQDPFTKGKKPTFHAPLKNFCKLRLWQLTDYRRLVFLDADSVVLKPIDQLFQYPEFSGAPNLYESLEDMHRLNSGVFVAEPSSATFDAIMAQLDAPGAYWRRTDQTFLESFFPDWHGLPYCFNVLQYVYFNLPQLWRWPSIRVLHYQYEKPWEAEHSKRAQLKPLIDLWWQIHDTGTIPAEPIEAPRDPSAARPGD